MCTGKGYTYENRREKRSVKLHFLYIGLLSANSSITTEWNNVTAS